MSILIAALMILGVQAPEPYQETYYEEPYYGEAYYEPYYEDYYEEPYYEEDFVEPERPAVEADHGQGAQEEPVEAEQAEPAEAPDLYEQGVIYGDGYRYTYYVDGDVPSWFDGELGEDGIWRDDQGRVAVAYGMEGYGYEIETPYGTGVVVDHCPTDGTVDLLTEWW